MVPKEPKGGRATGTSFKGAFLYYTHDKREEGENVRLTSDRVDWMEFRNLSTDDPHLASSIMAATAKSQDDLKRQAGASLAGNKSDQTVYHYSLGWNPSEKDGLTKAEMLRAANESIRALGAEGNQAALIAHNDTAHPHVHVIINRVNPENGKMLDLWNSQKHLSKWAMAYEQERGQVHCNKRVENWNKRAKGEVFSAAKDNAYHKRDQAQTLGHANDNDTKKILAEQKRKDAELAAYGKKMHVRHSNQWELYSQRYQAGKAQIKGRLE
ncbi:MAG: relaxase/mobilization nuclease domain-containing protein, partial [Hyphomicrobiales bacterium]|nr:relaxase/mobilization nuclease domain-containing protein [Hyphomicrobiales bacterium]